MAIEGREPYRCNRKQPYKSSLRRSVFHRFYFRSRYMLQNSKNYISVAIADRTTNCSLVILPFMAFLISALRRPFRFFIAPIAIAKTQVKPYRRTFLLCVGRAFDPLRTYVIKILHICGYVNC